MTSLRGDPARQYGRPAPDCDAAPLFNRMGTWNGESGEVLSASVTDREARWIPGASDVGGPGGTRLVVLSGLSGSGKSALLAELAALGEPVLDLQGLAAHRGSVFGGFGRPPQPRNHDFQRAVRAALATMPRGRVVWLERCPVYLGSVGLPPELVAALDRAPHVELWTPRAARVAALAAEYGETPVAQWHAALDRVAPRLGSARTAAARAELDTGRVPAAVDVLLGYYDAAYRRVPLSPATLVLPPATPANRAARLTERLVR